MANEIKELIDLIEKIGDDELFDKAHTILIRRRDFLFNFPVSSAYGAQLDGIVVNSLKTIINDYMKTKEIKITPPEGYEIDKENSTFDCIKFKPVAKRWRGAYDSLVSGYLIEPDSSIRYWTDLSEGGENINIFATEKQAKSALAMAQISQIMANDERFGGVVTDKEWYSGESLRYIIDRYKNEITTSNCYYGYNFLAFHTREQRDLFLKENKDLVKDYLMID